ncbi:MAG: hypothetical protein FWC57_00420 [Endomicrobia bacterium]|nr:hypothetical protein [Endomicrobiia bacterium]
MKKLLSSIICLSLFLPLAAGSADAKNIYKACQNTGIAGYYAFMSDAAFKMVKVVFQDSFKSAAEASKAAKKESPANKQQERSGNSKAVIPNIAAQKTIKSANAQAFYYAPAVLYERLIFYGSRGPSGMLESFWLILLMTLMILSVRKKDNCAIFASDVFFKHPVML